MTSVSTSSTCLNCHQLLRKRADKGHVKSLFLRSQHIAESDKGSLSPSPLSQDNLDFIARRVRNVAKPFGGIQIIVTGDFFQLPPVSQKGQPKKFAFEAAAWEDCFSLQTELTFVYRQADQEFVRLLNEIRIGHCSRSAEQRLRLCSSIELPPDGIATTKLYPHKARLDHNTPLTPLCYSP